MSAPQVSRRSVARGAAWSVPLVAVGVAAPAFAASAPVPTPVVTGCQCSSGGKKYRVILNFTQSSTTSYSITAITVSIPSETITGTTPTTASVPTGTGTTTVGVVFTRPNNSASSTVTITYTIKNNTTNQSTNVTIGPSTITWPNCADGVC